jgi:hypothetical protein
MTVAEAYATLDLTPGAPPDDVRAAYLDLVKVWHPDRHSHEPERLRLRAQEKLQRINEAFDRLRGNAAPQLVLLYPLDFGGNFGYVDQQGAPVIYPQFAEARNFSEGLAAVRVVEKWGYINATGEHVIAPVYDTALEFSHGWAAVAWHGRWGYINRQGSFTVKPRFQAARSFDGEWAEVRLGARWGRIHRSGEERFDAGPRASKLSA